MRLGIVVSHPIQYYAPLFNYLAKKIDLVVIYCHNPTENEIGKDGFDLKFKWDTDLLSGYKSIFIKNISPSPSLSAFNGCNTPTIGLELKKEKVTHVLIFGWYLRSYWQAFFYCRKNNIPIANRGDSQLNLNENILKSLFKKIIYPVFLKKYNSLLYVGNKNKEYLIAHGATEKQLIFSPHAVDQQFWIKKNVSINKVKRFRFIWVAKFIDKKRPFDVIEAFLLASKKLNNIELTMVGSGPLYNESFKRANNHPEIRFAGFKNQTELLTEYANANCLILTSDKGETWGLVVNEAFGCQIPAIISDSCGCASDLINESITGFTYQEGNIPQLVEKMYALTNLLTENPDYFKKGIKEKNEVYSYENTCKGIVDFVNNC